MSSLWQLLLTSQLRHVKLRSRARFFFGGITQGEGRGTGFLSRLVQQEARRVLIMINMLVFNAQLVTVAKLQNMKKVVCG